MEIVQPPGAGTPGVTAEAPRPPLRDQGIGDGKVACLRATHRQVKERFIPESAFEPQSAPSPQRNPPYPKKRREKKRGADRNILAQALSPGG
jgi:hypothetical protein